MSFSRFNIMKEYILNANESGQRLDKYLFKLMPNAPKSFIFKMLRKKNIVLNGKKSEGNEITALGDSVKLFLADDTIKGFQKSEEIKINKKIPKPDILYEDENVLIMNKPVGILSQTAQKGDISMNEILQEYLLTTGKITSKELKTFKPAVVNRLDRNTSGIILAGKSLKGSQQLSEILKGRSFKKEYLCIVKGIVKKEMFLRGALSKDTNKNKVKISDDGESEIMTDIFPLAYGKDMTLLKVHLITGKTHQIRAHLSSVNHPLLGDGKYGDNNLNIQLKKKYGLRNQLLHAWRVSFGDTCGALTELKDKRIYAPVPKMFNDILKGENITWQPGQEED